MIVYVTIFSLVTYIVDIITDLILACLYYSDNAILEGNLTLTFVLLPGVSLLFDRFFREKVIQSCTCYAEILHEVLNGLKDAVLIVYCTIANYVNVIVNSKRFVRDLRYPDYVSGRVPNSQILRSINTLRFYETTMEALPQLIVQTILITRDIHQHTFEVNSAFGLIRLLAIACSLISVSWGILCYVSQTPLIFTRDCVRLEPFLERLLHFLSHVFLLAANGLALALALRGSLIGLLAIFGVRFLITFTWWMYDAEKKVFKHFHHIFLFLIGFCVFADDEHFCLTHKYMFAYLCDHVQNSCLIILWRTSIYGTVIVDKYPLVFIFGHYIALIAALFLTISFYEQCRHFHCTGPERFCGIEGRVQQVILNLKRAEDKDRERGLL